MRIHHGFDNIPTIVRPVVTIGSFDGVHLGHVALIGEVTEEAQRIGGSSVVVTFTPHPRQVLPNGGDFKLLSSPQHRAELLAACGVDELIEVEFNLEFAALTAEEFVRHYLVEKLHIHTLVVGYNHRFGHEKNLPSNHFELLGESYGFNVLRASAFTLDGGKVSSSVIRKLIEEGNIERAEQLLGHPL